MTQSHWVSQSFIDITGQLVNLPWQAQSAWVWAPPTKRERGKPNAHEPKERPFLRTWVEVRPPYKLVSASSSSGRVTPEAKDSPFKLKRGPVFSFDTDSDTDSNMVDLRYIDPKGQEREVSLLVQISIKQPLYWIDQSCASIGIWIAQQSEETSKFLYTAIRCEERGDSIGVQLFHSPDAYFHEVRVPDKKAEGAGWMYFFGKTPAKARQLGTFTIGPRNRKDTSTTYVLGYEPNASKRRYSISASLGGTMLNYAETPGQVSLSEFGLTGKVAGSYVLVPDLFDLAANAFMTLIPATWQTTSLPLARFYGINGRIGYRLPVTPFNRLWSLSPGWYFWGMLVPNHKYGIQALAGPQMLLTMRTPYGGPRAYYGYLKFAPITESTQINFANREIAIGGGYTLDTKLADHLMTVTLDVAQTSYVSASQGNSLNMISYSLGLSFGF